MLLSHHRSHTEYALNRVELEDDKKAEILKGAYANDLCEFTNEGEFFIPSKDVVHSLFGTKEKKFGFSAIYQSHFGNLAAMHAMAKSINEPPIETKNEIAAWFDFLNALALGKLSIDPDSKIGEGNTVISHMFSNHSIEYNQIFDSENMDEIKYRSIGMMCHLIQDLFTFSHCKRNSHNEITMFYYYEAQDKQKHKNGDFATPGLENELTKQCCKCIEDVTNGIAYNAAQVLILSKDAQYSSGGDFA